MKYGLTPEEVMAQRAWWADVSPAVWAKVLPVHPAAVDSLLFFVADYESAYGRANYGDTDQTNISVGMWQMNDVNRSRYQPEDWAAWQAKESARIADEGGDPSPGDWRLDAGASARAALAYLGDSVWLDPWLGVVLNVPYHGHDAARRLWRRSRARWREPLSYIGREADAIQEHGDSLWWYIVGETTVAGLLTLWQWRVLRARRGSRLLLAMFFAVSLGWTAWGVVRLLWGLTWRRAS